MTNCRSTKKQLGRYFDHELSPDESLLVEDHLKLCSRCNSEFQQIREIAGAFHDNLPVPPVPLHLTQRILEEAYASVMGRLSWWEPLPFWRNWSTSMRLAALGVAAIACYLGLVISGGLLPQTRPASAEMRGIGMTSQEPIVKAYLGSAR
jgi:anti-sigma factor RsiW